MTYQFDGHNYIIRLERGEEVIEKLLAFAKEKKIAGAWISGLGGVESVELGYYDLDEKTYKWRNFDSLVEITALQGNIAWSDDEPAIHLHATLTDREYRAFGGHVKKMITGGTCEIFLHIRFDRVHRALDESSGLNLLDL